MRIRAEFSDGMKGALHGRAIGDEFTVTATARIISAEEALIDVRTYGDQDVHVMQGELEVTLLISKARVLP